MSFRRRIPAVVAVPLVIALAGSSGAFAAEAPTPPVPPRSEVVLRSDSRPALDLEQRAALLGPGSSHRSVSAGEPKRSARLTPSATRPTAPPFTDANPPYACPGYSSIPSTNPRAQVLADRFAWGVFPAFRVGNGKGDINWKANPHRQVSWYMWLHSLRWIGSLITSGDSAALNHAAAIAADWVRDNPYSWQSNAAAWESTMHRTDTLLCLRQALAKRAGATLPAAYRWLDASLLDHAEFMRRHFSGYGNHGTDESIAMLGVGCVLRRPDYVSLASSRLATNIGRGIDAQGATNEQSTGYAAFNYSLWGDAQRALNACTTGSATARFVASRRAALIGFLTHSTTPLQTLFQIGATELKKYPPLRGTSQEWAATAGASGVAPRQRVRMFSAGYVFGRSGWGTGKRPFAEEMAYSLRFGPGRQLHGHDDRTSLTWQTRGTEILADTGYGQYTRDAWEAFSASPAAHNQVVIPGMTPGAATKLTASSIRAGADMFRVTDRPGPALGRVRDVLFLSDPDLVVVVDRASTTARRGTTYRQVWQLPADTATVSMSSRGTSVAANKKGTRTTLIQLPVRGAAVPARTGSVVKGATSPIQGWKWPTIFTKMSSPTVSFSRSGRSATLATAIVASDPAARVSVVGAKGPKGSYVYTFTVGRTVAKVGLSAGGSLYRIR